MISIVAVSLSFMCNFHIFACHNLTTQLVSQYEHLMCSGALQPLTISGLCDRYSHSPPYGRVSSCGQVKRDFYFSSFHKLAAGFVGIHVPCLR